MSRVISFLSGWCLLQNSVLQQPSVPHLLKYHKQIKSSWHVFIPMNVWVIYHNHQSTVFKYFPTNIRFLRTYRQCTIYTNRAEIDALFFFHKEWIQFYQQFEGLCWNNCKWHEASSSWSIKTWTLMSNTKFYNES